MIAEEPSPPQVVPHRWRRASRLLALAASAILLVLLGSATGYTITSSVPPLYAARADVLYLLTREQPTGFLRQDRNLSTQLVLLSSRTVLGPVAEGWAIDVEVLAESLETTVVEESEIIQIALTDTDPERARLMLEAIIQNYLAVSNNDERADLRNYLDGQLIDILARTAEIRGDLDRQGELAPLVDREQQLRTQLDELQLSDLAGPAARVLEPAYVPTRPVGTEPLVGAATGGLAALLVAALAGAVLARRATRT